MKLKVEVSEGKMLDYSISNDGTLRFSGKLCVPNHKEIRDLVLREAHRPLYIVHPGSTKMYWDLNKHFWWNGMKQEIGAYVAQCLTCERVKVEHQRPSGTLHPLIDCQSQPTLFLLRWCTPLIDWLSCMSRRLLGYMEYHLSLSLTEIHVSPQLSSGAYRRSWELNWLIAYVPFSDRRSSIKDNSDHGRYA